MTGSQDTIRASGSLPDGCGLSQVKKVICEEATRISVERYGQSLRAIVLTGSLARDEATFVRQDQVWRSPGDADFFLVFHQPCRLPSDSAAASLGREIEAALAGRGVLIHAGLAPVTPSYLLALPPQISAYELRVCGRVVWGDPGILGLIPAFSAADLSLEDAWRLLANRIIEQLESFGFVQDAQNLPEAAYRTVKLYLDMTTSFLVFAGRYAPTYRERERELRRLAVDPSPAGSAPFSLREFSERVGAATRLKLGTSPDGDWARRFEVPPGAAVAMSEEAIRFARLLWRWELARLCGETAQVSGSELMARWMAQQPARQTLRGWFSLLRRCGWHRSWRQWPRWMRLARRASPRYWIYAAAAELFFALPDPAVEADWLAVAHQLPLLRHTGPLSGADGHRRLAREAAWNYRQFLETTRA